MISIEMGAEEFMGEKLFSKLKVVQGWTEVAVKLEGIWKTEWDGGDYQSKGVCDGRGGALIYSRRSSWGFTTDRYVPRKEGPSGGTQVDGPTLTGQSSQRSGRFQNLNLNLHQANEKGVAMGC